MTDNVAALVALAQQQRTTQQQMSDNVAALLRLAQQQPAPQAKPEAPSALVRFGHGMNEALGGLYQGALYAKDAVTGGHSYDDYTAAQRAGEAIYQQGREANGQTGLDGWSLAGNITSTLPAGAAFKGMQGVGVLSKAGAQIMGRNALAGAAIAGAGLADDAKSRIGHMTAGAVLAPLVGVAMDKAASGIGKMAINRMARPAVGDAQAQAAAKAQAAAHVEVALKQAGIPIAQINDTVKEGLVSDVAKMLQAGKTVDPKAIARKATLDSLRLTGTQAQVSGNPVEWQAEREMAKIQGVGDALRQKFVDDSEHLAQRLDQTARATLGTSGQDSHAAMQGVFDVLRANDAKRQDAVRSLYDQARNAIGNDLQLDARRMVANLSQDLEHHGLGSFLKSDVKGMLGRFASGSEPLTLAKKEELVKIINARLASTTDGSQRYALGMVRQHLEAETEQALNSVPVLLLQQGDLPAVQAWQSARQEAAKRFGVIDRTPAIQSALDDMAPDKAFEKLVLRADVRDLKALRNELSQNPQAIHDLRRQMVEHISRKAVNPNTGQFSPVAMRKALEAVGDRRLGVLFTPKQVARLKQIDAAANVLMSEPRGAAVNHANTGATLTNHLLRVVGLLGKVPVLGNTLSGAANLTVKMATKASAAGKAEKMAAGGLQASGRVVTPAMQEQLASLGLAVDATGRIVRLTSSQTAGVSAAGH